MVGDQSMRIADLLESRVAIISASLGLPIARPNIVFDPPDAPYARVYVLPAQTVGQDIEGLMRTYQDLAGKHHYSRRLRREPCERACPVGGRCIP